MSIIPGVKDLETISVSSRSIILISVVIFHTPQSDSSSVFSYVKFGKRSYPSSLAVYKCLVGRYSRISQLRQVNSGLCVFS